MMSEKSKYESTYFPAAPKGAAEGPPTSENATRWDGLWQGRQR